MQRSTAVRTTMLALAAILLLATAAPAGAADPSTTPTHLAGLRGHGSVRAWDRQPEDPAAADTTTRLLVRFRTGTTRLERQSITTRPGLRRLADVASGSFTVVTASSRAAIARLQADPNVASLSVDHRRYRDLDPTAEPGWVEQWGMDNTGQPLYQGQSGTEGEPNVDIDGLQALGVTTGDPSVVVAVIDDGVDFSHPDLAARAWTNPGESGGGKETNGIDDDGNGYIDDVHGWDFCHDDNTVHDFDNDFHGTHVAGTIAASLDGVGVVGVAPSVSIMALKFIGDDTEPCGFDSQAIAAIAYAKSFGVHIANASWGGRGTPGDAPELYDAIADSGMLFVASAGNSGIDNDTDPLPALPASFDLPNILSVAAIDNNGFVAGFSNVGETTVDISAPGVAILSSLPADSTYPVGWGWLDGTSMAAPHVTGAAALIASADPSMADDPAAMKARILGSGKKMPFTDGLTVTGDTVDAFRALDVGPPIGATPIDFGFVGGQVMGRTTVAARVSWPAATDDLTGVGAYGVLVRVDQGAWATQTSATLKRTTDRVVKFGRTYAFRVRPRDGAGNWGSYLGSPSVKPYLHQETTSLGAFTGAWGTSRGSAWSGGKTRYTRSAGASATFRFTGRAFALVAPKGSTRGKAKLYIDGFYISTIDLYRSKSLARVVVATRTWSASATHTIKLVVLGGGSHPRFDVDALLVMR